MQKLSSPFHVAFRQFLRGTHGKKMGLPVKRFIAANNANDVFVEFLKTGGFTPQKALITLARAMDVGNPSNIARIIDLYGATCHCSGMMLKVILTAMKK